MEVVDEGSAIRDTICFYIPLVLETVFVEKGKWVALDPWLIKDNLIPLKLFENKSLLLRLI